MGHALSVGTRIPHLRPGRARDSRPMGIRVGVAPRPLSVRPEGDTVNVAASELEYQIIGILADELTGRCWIELEFREKRRLAAQVIEAVRRDTGPKAT